MAFNPFIGKSQDWLETELAKAQDDLAAGKSTISANSGDIGVRNQLDFSLRERIRLILQALSILDSTSYPPASITPSGATKIVFNSSTTT